MLKHLNEIQAKPASDDLIEHLSETLQQRLDHEHPERGEDLYCLNLTSYMGERMGWVLARLRDTETALATAKADTAQIVVTAEGDSLTIGCTLDGCVLIESWDDREVVSLTDLLAAAGKHQHVALDSSPEKG